VIDEVHMLSNSAFNAMLKTLEEPPEHVKFILATTDPQKIPVTVLSRCLQFNLKQMPPLAITRIICVTFFRPRVPYDLSGAQADCPLGGRQHARCAFLARSGDRPWRGQVEEAQVRAMLGTVDLDYLYAILDAVHAGDAGELLRVAADIAVRSLSFGAALQDLGAC
jgi:DNA polymerase-3 subunit gamma/tau